jgi:hypothetical protein
VAYGLGLRVKENGVIGATNALARILVVGLQLDRPDLRKQRRLVLPVVRLAEAMKDLALLRSLLGYLDDWPSLRAKGPRGRNV